MIRSAASRATYPKVLLAIHGYPPRYNAGSEVYTQTLALGLAKRGVKVDVFAREEDPFSPDYQVRVERDSLNPQIPVFLANHARSNARYANKELDDAFASVVKRSAPDIIHMGHLNHLSTGFVDVAKSQGVPVVFTLHDFWMMCPRGQFLQTKLTSGSPWELCGGQEDRKCALECFNRFRTGDSAGTQMSMSDDNARTQMSVSSDSAGTQMSVSSDSAGTQMSVSDDNYWTEWVRARMAAVRDACDKVDLFIAPSEHLMRRFVDEFHIPPAKIKYLDYGFDIARLTPHPSSPSPLPPPSPESGYVFGYIGRHHPSKGIDMLISAFAKVEGKAKLIIWGRAEGQLTASLKRLADKLIRTSDKTIEWRAEYKNERIVEEVFNHCHCIVVPSVWDENSPLVIHEAQQVHTPVITADHGGMSEFVKDGKNGLLFKFRDTDSLRQSLQKAMDNPQLMTKLGQRGYIKSENGDIPSADAHVAELLGDYAKILAKSRPAPAAAAHAEVPWRVTFDTNPDDCNLKCVMCEEHSPLSSLQQERKAANKRRRRMDINVIKKVVEECAGKGLQEIIPSTMGEPLMYKDFPQIVDLCREHNVKLNLTTNGTFWGRGVEEWAGMIVPVASDVKISWNGATKETQDAIMLGSSHEARLKNLEIFLKFRDAHYLATGGRQRCTVTLQYTFMERNVHELPDVVRLAISLGCDRVKGHHLWAHFGDIKEESMRRSPESIARWNAIVRECVAIANSTPLPPLPTLPSTTTTSSATASTTASTTTTTNTTMTPSRVPHEISVKSETPLPPVRKIKLENIFELDIAATDQIHPQAVCPFVGKEAWVNPEGRFDPCCAPNNLRMSLGSFGNVADSGGLLPLWKSEKYSNLVQNYHYESLCKSCNMRRPPTPAPSS